jgi:oligogalacturonide lyase
MSLAIGIVFKSEFSRYADPATELDVVRLTNPEFASGISAPHLRQFTRRGDAMVYWSERDGTRQIYRLDLKSGESKQLTSAAALDVTNFSLSPDDRYLFYFDGPVLQSATSGLTRPRDVYKVAGGATEGGLTVASDGSVLFAEGPRIMRVALQKTGPVVEGREGGGTFDLVMARPRHPQLFYRQDGAFWLVNTDGTGRKQLSLSAGMTGEALWSPTGRTLLYLHIPDDPKQLVTLRENNPDDSTDQLIARTSQFASFAPNADASVFAGASRSKASAYILILLRVTKRELTLCEHRASDPSIVSVVFAPDSQSIVFVSDRHGKPALYRVPVEKFVEETSDQ